MTCGRFDIDFVPGQLVALRTRGAAQCKASNGQILGRGDDIRAGEGDVGVGVSEIGEISGVDEGEEMLEEDIKSERAAKKKC